MLGSKKETASLVKFDEGKIDSIVSSNITIEGKFKSTGSIRLDCKVIGEVESESLFLGKEGLVKGNIKCDNIIVAGKIEGNIVCENKLHIKETGIIDGDITVNVLSMDEGAEFSGNCIRKGKEQKQDTNQDKNTQSKK